MSNFNSSFHKIVVFSPVPKLLFDSFLETLHILVWAILILELRMQIMLFESFN